LSEKPKIKLPHHVKVFIENELREYKIKKAQLKQLKQDRQDIYYKSRQAVNISVQSGEPGDPTSAAGILAERTDQKIKDLEFWIGRIDSGLAACTERERKLIETRYFNPAEPTDEEVMVYLGFGYRNDYFDTKFRALGRIAKMYELI